jgi:hypothetical protein
VANLLGARARAKEPLRPAAAAADGPGGDVVLRSLRKLVARGTVLDDSLKCVVGGGETL